MAYNNDACWGNLISNSSHPIGHLIILPSRFHHLDILVETFTLPIAHIEIFWKVTKVTEKQMSYYANIAMQPVKRIKHIADKIDT